MICRVAQSLAHEHLFDVVGAALFPLEQRKTAFRHDALDAEPLGEHDRLFVTCTHVPLQRLHLREQRFGIRLAEGGDFLLVRAVGKDALPARFLLGIDSFARARACKDLFQPAPAKLCVFVGKFVACTRKEDVFQPFGELRKLFARGARVFEFGYFFL